MKQRLLSSVVGLSILFTVFAFFDTVVLNVAVAIVIVLALDELIAAAGYQRNLKLKATALAFGGLIPFFQMRPISTMLAAICFLFALVLFCILLHDHATLRAEQMGFTFFFTMAIAFSTTCFVFLRDVFGTTVGMFGILVTLVGAWCSDAGAYFCGIAFGRHKLAPSISPKKTVEGAIGGVVVAAVCQILIGVVYTWLSSAWFGQQVSVRYGLLLALSPVLSVLSMIGDLSASVVKRQFGIKDFGKIIPGHGGVLDRFDSVLLVIPFVYILFLYCPLIRVW